MRLSPFSFAMLTGGGWTAAGVPAAQEATVRHPQLDALRGVAIAFVFLYHLYPNRLPGGYIGVDVFFVLSGYLAALAVRKEHFSLATYLRKRVERLLPPLLVMLAASMAVGFVLLFTGEYVQLARHTFKSLLFVQNLQLESELNYFDKELQLKPLANLWSLSVEMQLYVLAVPLLHLIGRQFGARSARVIISATVVAALWSGTHLHGTSYYDALPRLIPFLSGALLGYLPKGRSPQWALANPRLNGSSVAVLPLCAAGLLALALKLNGSSQYPGWLILLPTAFTLGLIHFSATASLSSFIADRLRPLVFLGLISYSLYLWHWPIISFAKIQMSGDTFSTGLKLQLALLSVVVAWMSHRFIERATWPTRLAKLPYSTSLMGAAGLLAAAAFVMASYPVTYAQITHRDDHDLDATTTINNLYRWRFKDKDCLALVSFAPPQCRFTDRGARPRVAILGDSHAGALYDGLDQALGSHHMGVIHLGAPGCPPFYSLNRLPGLYKSWDKCSTAINPALDYARHDKDIEVIVLSVYFDWTRKDEPSVDSELVYEGDTLLEGGMAWRASMRRTLSTLQKSGKKILFVLDVPHLGFDPKSCKTLRPVLGDAKRQSACHQSRDDIESQYISPRKSHIIETLKEFPGVVVVNAADAVCDQSRCYGMKDGALLYSDSNHLSVAGSILVGKLITDQMKSAKYIDN